MVQKIFKVCIISVVCLAFPVSAQTIRSFSNFTPAGVDGLPGGGISSVERSVSIGSSDFTSGGTVQKVMVQLHYEKIDGGSSGNEASACADLGGAGHQGGQVKNDEIGFSLRSPSGTLVSLIKSEIPGPSTFHGSSYGGKVYQLFDSTSGATQNGRPKPQAGIVKPEESFSSYNGESPVGNWTLVMEDSREQNPLCSSSFTLIILTDLDAPVNPNEDSDNDGINNSLECPSGVDCPDTDGDGIPDYLDPDANNDGTIDTPSDGGGGSGGGTGGGGIGQPDEDGVCVDLRPYLNAMQQSALDLQALLPSAFKTRKSVLRQITCPGAKAPTSKSYTTQVTSAVDALVNELMESTASLPIEDENSCQTGVCSTLDLAASKLELSKKLKAISKAVKKNVHRLCLNAKSSEYFVSESARKAIKNLRSKLKAPLNDGLEASTAYPDSPVSCTAPTAS